MKTPSTRSPENAEICIGVSACLLGQEVRYDGGHARDSYIVDTLADFLNLVPVCPEDELGMGTPRETVRLVGDPQAPRMVGSVSAKDWTPGMNRWSARRSRELGAGDLCGYIFKSKSPSCGVFKVKVYTGRGERYVRGGRGLFAAEFSRRFPLVPIEDEGGLNESVLRENFIERVFAYRRLKDLFEGRWKRGEVIEFHSREKYLLMAHSPQGMKKLDRLTAGIRNHKPAEFRDAYMKGFMEIMALKATTRKHTHALQHLAGYLRDHISTKERKRVLVAIEDYRKELVPLIVPMTLLHHQIETNDLAQVNNQTYLNPHPRELMLRNHV